MTKFIKVIILLSMTINAFSCDVETYFSKAEGLDGYRLKSVLRDILAASHRNRKYGDLMRAYRTTDRDRTYDNDGTILDMYSENPTGKDPYVYRNGSKQCGNYKVESNCYNREHLFPQGLFYKRSPMKSDIFHVFPTDGKVNGNRGSYPFGEVKNPKWTSLNGSKTGLNTFSSYRGMVFEPIDEFKGDIARAMLYFATRYQKQIPSFKQHPMIDGSSSRVYTRWFLKLLLKWHKQDPVSEHEVTRNDAGCKFQKNRNPFIDRPEWVQAIWESK